MLNIKRIFTNKKRQSINCLNNIIQHATKVESLPVAVKQKKKFINIKKIK